MNEKHDILKGESPEQIIRHTTLTRYDRLIAPCLVKYEKIFSLQDHSPQEVEVLCAQKKTWLESHPEYFAVPRLDLIVTTICNLRCEKCNNTVPNCKKPRHIDSCELIKQGDKMLSAVDECVTLNITGGETFLYPHLKEVLEHFLNCEKIVSIELITNATIIPHENLVPLLQNNKVIVDISDYGNLTAISKLIDFLEQRDICFSVFVDFKWKNPGGLNKRGKSVEQLQREYARCSSGRLCKSILNGRLYHCTRSAFMTDSGYIPESDLDSLDVYGYHDTDSLRAASQAFFMRDYTNACDYCDANIDDPEFIPPGVQAGTLGESSTSRPSAYTVIKRSDYQGLKSWVGELNDAKEWLETQYLNYKKLYEETKNAGSHNLYLTNKSFPFSQIINKIFNLNN